MKSTNVLIKLGEFVPQEGWPDGVGFRVQSHGSLFESWWVPCEGGDFHGLHYAHTLAFLRC